MARAITTQIVVIGVSILVMSVVRLCQLRARS